MTGSNSRMKASFCAAALRSVSRAARLRKLSKSANRRQAAVPLNGQLRLQRADVRRGNGIRSGVAARLLLRRILIRIHIMEAFAFRN
jgi:hypothetical protein